MQTQIESQYLETDTGQRANEILRKCVHCGFCTATCPTYQLLGDELDGPRGRIYQVKLMLEGQKPDREILSHLDRCLTCRSCESTCPSGVVYSELIDIGRELVEQENLRSPLESFKRFLLGAILPHTKRNRSLLKLASWLRPILPTKLRLKAPIIRTAQPFIKTNSTNKPHVLLLQGCVQSTLSPNTNAAAEALLCALGYQVIREPVINCCGAVNHHLSQQESTHHWINNNLNQWAEINASTPLHAIVSTASGCGVMLKDYPRLLKGTELLSQHENLLGKIKDIAELLDAETLTESVQAFSASQQSITFHAPCTLSHGHQLAQRLASELALLGYQLKTPLNAHICCGSAGTYSILQPEISRQLRDQKLAELQVTQPDLIITANVGCEHHLNSATNTRVIHWVELVAADL